MAGKRSSADAPYVWMKIMSATVFILMLIVWEHVEALHLQRQNKGMKKEEDQLIYENARMQSQINQWESPSHLDNIARKELGMQPLDPKHRIGVDYP
jgi:cell division protein FtsL